MQLSQTIKTLQCEILVWTMDYGGFVLLEGLLFSQLIDRTLTFIALYCKRVFPFSFFMDEFLNFSEQIADFYLYPI